MSADPHPSDENKLTAPDTEVAGVHGPQPEAMEVQVDDRTDTDFVSTGDTRADAPVAMDVDPGDTREREEDGDRKAQEVEASPTANTDAVGDKENAGYKTDEQLKNGHVSGKGDVGIDTGEVRKTGDESDEGGVSHEGVSVQHRVDHQKEQGQGKNTDVQQNAGEPRAEVSAVGDKKNAQENTDEATVSDNKNSDSAGDKDVQQDTDKSGESENKDEDSDGDHDNMQLSPHEPPKTGDVDMDDVSDKDDAQQNAEDSVDKDIDDDGDKERSETPDNTPRFPPRKRPTTLEEWGYTFNKEGELRDEDGKPFEFQFYDNHADNQKRYEDIGELITEYVYNLLETEGHLKRIWLPTDASEDEAQSFFFATEDYLTCDKLLILIHGSGVVRAGQWARRLIINNNLECGTQLPYIKRGVEEGYGVMVLNTNLNRVKIDGRYVPIRENSSPDSHGLYVWDNFVAEAKATHIAIVAHSYGGVVTSNLLRAKTDDFRKKVFAVAFTDSVHSVPYTEKCQQFFHQNARNWVSSRKPLDTPLNDYGDDAPHVSSGHTTHEWTSWSSFDSIFEFFAEKYTARIEKLDKEQEEDNAPLSSDKTPPSSDKTPSSSDKTPPSSDKTPLSSDKTPPLSDKSPPSSDKSPPSSDKTPPSSDKTPPSSDKTPPSSDKTPPSSDKTPPSSDKTPPSSDKTPPSSDKTPPSSDKTPV